MTGRLDIANAGWGWLADAEPQALGVTYWFEAARAGEPYRATVRFTGHRLGPEPKPGPGGHFTVSETVERIMPGSGRVAVTARVADVDPGDWAVTAVVTPGHRTKATASGSTGFAPVVRARAPGVRLGAWPACVGIGVGVALAVQSRLAGRAHVPVGATLAVSSIASVVGLLGARIYYLADQRPRPPVTPDALLTAGMCIQGFIAAAVPAAGVGVFVAGIPVGRFLDAAAPGLLFGMAIGRFGCLFGGCCAGRFTASRWGLWSSDRRVGARRVPVQLLESAVAATIGAASLLAVLSGAAEPPGAVFVAAIAAYTLGRQLLLPWRDLPRRTPRGRALALAVTAAVVLVDVAVAVVV